MLAQTVSKLLLIVITGILFGIPWIISSRILNYFDRKTEDWCGNRFQGLTIQHQRIPTEQDVARLMRGTFTWTRRLQMAVLLLSFINVIFIFFEWSRQVVLPVTTKVALVFEKLLFPLVENLPVLFIIAVIILLVGLPLHFMKVVYDGLAAKKIRNPVSFQSEL